MKHKIVKFFLLAILIYIGFSINSTVYAKTIDYSNATNINVSNIIPIGNKCVDYFGNISDGPTMPAYWIDWAIKLIKYAAIIAVLVLSTLDFIKAITAQDSDAIKKATTTASKRFIFAVMIFFLPVIIDLVLSLFGIPGCGFGE